MFTDADENETSTNTRTHREGGNSSMTLIIFMKINVDLNIPKKSWKYIIAKLISQRFI